MLGKTKEPKKWISNFNAVNVNNLSAEKAGLVNGNIQDEVNIVLTPNIDARTLPYAESKQLSDEYLTSIGAQRFCNCMVVARGDSRSPEEIFEAGGFHPKFTSPGSVAKNDISEVLDVLSHRGATEGSGLVSYTSAPSIAQSFGSDEGGYFYLVKATGAVGPSAKDFYKNEKEYSVPGGIDAEDIIAIRRVKKGADGKLEGEILISKDFIKKYPDKVPNAIAGCLTQDEKIALIIPKAIELLANVIEINAAKMKPSSTATQGYYNLRSLFASDRNKDVSLTATTIRNLHAICNKNIPPPEKLKLLGENIQNKIHELQLKKFSGELYKGCGKNSSDLNINDLKGEMPDQYKAVIALHLALQEPREKFYAALLNNLKEIKGFEVGPKAADVKPTQPIAVKSESQNQAPPPPQIRRK